MTSSNKNPTTAIFNSVHRAISRLRAEELLLDAKQDGSFLIRESETVPGAYTLCILFENRVHQYRILPDSEGKLSIQSEAGVVCRKYVDLTQLIHEYMQRGSKNGMAGPLLYPLPVDSISDDEGECADEVEDEAERVEIGAASNDSESCYSSVSSDGKDDMNEFLYRYFLQRFRSLNLSRCDGQFIDALQNYVETGANIDAQMSSSGAETMTSLRKVLYEAVKDIDKELDVLMMKIDLCRQLFGPITTAPLINADKTEVRVPDIANVFDRISRCKAAVQNLEKKAKLKFTDLTVMWKEGGVMMTDNARQQSGGLPMKPVIPATSFEAKVVSVSGRQSKIKLTVDIQAGKLLAIKPSKDCLNDKNVFTHDRIEQLILSTTNNSRLDLQVTGLGKKTYIFEDLRQRENFCQLVQQLKNTHSLHPEVKKISFYIGTWNMGGEMPMYSLLQWIKSDGLGKGRNSTLAMIPHDFYVFGTQESVLSDKEWTNRLRILLTETFGEEFYQVALTSLWSIRLVIFAKLDHKNKISNIHQSSVKTGLANALGNKGAVAVSFNFSRTSFCFICTHLTSGHEKLKRRNQNVRDIIKGLDLGPKKLGVFDVTKQFHHLFFFGDLNYRIEELDSLVIIKKIKESNNYSSLLEFDQLRRTQQAKQVFVGFREDEITFPPTYRFKKGTRDKYVWQKFKTTGTRINAPSYCDRVLWQSYPETPIVNTSYGCTDRICSSDHKPVFASFVVGVTTQFTSAQGGNAPSGDMKIIFEEISAEVKTSKQDNFKIEFHSSCLEGPMATKQNSMFDSKKDNFCCPKWMSTQLPELQPIFDERDYLEDQHLLVAVKTADGMESYGECVIALKSAFAIQPQKFSYVLTHLGEETGSIRGLMHVKAKENSATALRNQKTHKIYDLIYMDTECLHDEGEKSAAIYQDRTEVVNECNDRRKNATLPAPVLTPSPLPGSLSTPCFTDSDAASAICCSAKEIGDNSDKGKEEGNFYEDVPSGPPNLPPRKGRLMPPFADPYINSTQAIKASANVQPTPVARFRPAPVQRRSDVTINSSPASSTLNRLIPPQQPNRASYMSTNLYSEFETTTDRPPLPLPDSKTNMKQQTNDPNLLNPSSPGSIAEWLSGLGLSPYISAFINNGWDHIDFVSDMTTQDLISLNIMNGDHQKKILDSIDGIKKGTHHF